MTNNRQNIQMKSDCLLELLRAGFKLVQAPYKRKSPVLRNWPKKWIRSEEELLNILKTQPLSNFVIIPHDDWIVYDIDPRNGGLESYQKLKNYFNRTFKVITGSGGFHYYYKLPKGFNKPLRNNLSAYTGIDIKTSTGCLVAPESIHPNGQRYRIADDSINTLTEVPPELLKLAIKQEEYPEKVRNYNNKQNHDIQKGGRNNAVTSYVGSLFSKGLEYKDVQLLADAYNSSYCKPPLSRREVAGIVKSISRYNNAQRRKNRDTKISVETVMDDKDKPIGQIVEEILTEGKMKTDIRFRLVSEVIIKDLSECGKFYKSNGNYYIFDNKTKMLISINKGNINLKTLLAKYRINAARDIFKIIYEALIVHCQSEGEETEVYKYSHFDIDSGCLYLKNHNMIYKITEDDVIKCDNGTDKVLFTDTVEVEPYEYINNIKEDYLKKCLLNLPNYSQMPYLSNNDAKTIVAIYLHALFMPDLLQTKPLISTVGSKGSGKTTLLRMMLKCIYGKYADVTAMTNKMEDLDTIIAKRHFIVIDNLDTFKDSINDKIASYATGVVNEKRRLYSDGDVYKERVEAFIGISTRNPVFRRDDITQRVIIIYLEPLTKFSTERQIIEPVMKYRNEILSQIIQKLQGIIKLINRKKFAKTSSSFRMADFAYFTALYLNNHLKAEDLLLRISKTQRALVLDGDILITYLVKYVAENRRSGFPPEWLTAAQFYEQLDGRAATEKKDTLFKNEFRERYENSISLGKRLTNIKSDISEYIKIEIRKNSGNVTTYRVSAGECFNELLEGLLKKQKS